MATKKKPTFEEQLAEVEQIIGRMENGGTTLEETLKDYEAGAKAIAALEKELSAARQRLTVLRAQADGTEKEEPLEVDG